MESVVHWLERWNRATMVIRLLDHERLRQEVLLPAKHLAPYLEQGEAYRQWLTRRCLDVVGVQVPFVAAHNDLTMSNMLIDKQGRLGVVDWESSCEQGFPLVDFFYAVADAVAATRAYSDRFNAFQACFTPGGIFSGTVARLQNGLQRALSVSVEVANICFHACWLHHALNEHYRDEPQHRRRFLKIVQWLAWHHHP
jgi:hypothetical protein